MRNYIMSKIEKRKPTYKLPFKLCFIYIAPLQPSTLAAVKPWGIPREHAV